MLKRFSGGDGPLGIFFEYPVLLRLACISVCAEIAWGTLIVVLQYYFKDQLLVGQNPQLIGSRIATVTLAFVACETLFKVPMGALSDRIGPRPLIYFALGVASISPILMSFTREWYYFVPLRALDGLGAAALWPSMSALMARSVGKDAKSAAMSVFNGAYCLGLAIGPMIGLFLGHRFGNNRVFPLCSILLLGGLAVAWGVLKSGVGDKPTEVARDATAHIGADFPSQDGSLLRQKPILLRMMILYALSQVAVGMLANVLVLYLDYQFHIKEGDLPRLIAGPAFAVAFIAIPLGRLADTIGRPRAVWISYAMATVGMFIVAATSWLHPTHGLLAPSVLIFGLGMTLLIGSYILGTPAWLGLTSVQVDNARQAHALSLMQTAQGFGVVVGAGLVAFSGPFLTRLDIVREKVRQDISRHAPHFPHMPHMPKMPALPHLPHLPRFPHLPHHMTNPLSGTPLPSPAPSSEQLPHIAVKTIAKLHDTVPISVWLWASVAVFAICFVGTLLYVREPDSPDGTTLASSEQPLEISGV